MIYIGEDVEETNEEQPSEDVEETNEEPPSEDVEEANEEQPSGGEGKQPTGTYLFYIQL